MNATHCHTTQSGTPTEVFALQKYEYDDNKKPIFHDFCRQNVSVCAIHVILCEFIVTNAHTCNKSIPYTKRTYDRTNLSKTPKRAKPPLLPGWSAQTVKYLIPGCLAR